MNNKLPLYQLEINDVDAGLTAISLVKKPAIEIPFFTFSSEFVTFSVSDERKIITGPVIIPGQIIYRRRPEDGFEYQVTFSADKMGEILQRFHKVNSTNVTQEHLIDIKGAELLNMYLSDEQMGISAPKGYDSLPDKTLFVSYKIVDDNLWSEIKKGVFKGFSLEGFFNTIPIKQIKMTKDNIPSQMEIFVKLKSLLSEL